MCLNVAARLGLPLSVVLAMEPDELSLWAVFLFSENDIANRRQDERAAMLGALTWNSNGAKPQKTVDELMPRPRETNPKRMQAMLLAWVGGMKR